MNFGSLKDQLIDQLKELGGKIQDSSAYIELKEKFDTLPSHIQKLVIGVGAGLIGLFLLSFPYSYYSNSNTMNEEFTENRELIRDLMRASSTLKERSPLPGSSSTEQIESRVRQVINQMGITPEQVGNVQAIPGAKTRLAAAAVNQEAVSLQVKTLNLRQLTELMHQLQSLGNGMQPISMEVRRAQGETHYFDLIIKVFQFSLDAAEGDAPAAPAGRARPGRLPRGGGQ